MAEKSGKKSGPPGGFKEGKDPRRGRGPKKGAPNAGRPRDEFRQDMRDLASNPQTRARLKKLLTAKNGDDDTFLKAFKETADRGYGKAVQPLEHAGPDGGPIPLANPDELRERIARQLAGLAARADEKEGS